MASMLEAKFEEEAIKKYRRAVVEEFTSQYAAISSVLEVSMQKFVEKAFAAHLISETAMKSKDFFMIATDFKTGLQSKDTVLDIQHYCQSFIEILEDLGSPAVGVAKRLDIRWSAGKFLTTSGIQNSEHLVVFHEETNKVLDLVTDKIEQIPNLAKIAYHLQKSFAILCISVKEVLKTSSVHLNDAKLFIHVLLDSKVRPKLEAFHEHLQSITGFDSFFVFLNKHRFVGYLNYDVLKALAGLAKNEDINKQIGEYEKEYVEFLQDASFSHVLSIFSQYPDLKPAAVIGFPYDPVGFHLDSQRWSLKKICDWIISFGGICGSGGYQLDGATDSSILVTYVIFPSALPNVLRDLTDPVILQKFEDIGVRVQLPDSIREYLSEDLSALCMLPGEVSDTSVLHHDDEVEELAPPTLTGTLDPTTQILQRHLKALSQLVLSVETVQLLYTEGVISKDILDEVEKLGGSIANDPLSSICRTVSKDQKQLKVFASVLLHSKKTVPIATVLLKEYEKIVQQMSIFPTQHQITEDTISSLEKTVPSVAVFTEKGHTTTDDITVMVEHQKTNSGGFNEQSRSHFESLHQNFRNLICTLTSLIAVGVASLNEFKSFLKRYYKELKPQLEHANSFLDTMALIEEKYNVINVSCLETIINYYDVEDAKVLITDYKMEVNTFYEKVTLSMCFNQSFKSVSFSCLLTCETVRFTLEWKSDKVYLKNVLDLLSKVFKDNHNNIYVTDIRQENFVHVICYCPQHITNLLVIEAKKNSEALEKFEVIQLTIGYHTVWEYERDKDLSGKEFYETKENSIESNKELKSVPENTQKELKKRLEMINKISKTKTAENEQLHKEIERLKSQLDEKVEKITEPVKIMKGIELKSTEKQKEIESLQGVITLYSLKLREQEKTIIRLSKTLTDVRETLQVRRQFLHFSQKSAIIDDEDSQVPMLNDNWNADLQSPPVQTVMSNFSIHKKSDKEWYSPSFLSHPNGYEMCLRIIANGQYEGYGTHLSLYIHLMAGKNDDNLSWPFRGEVKVQLINHKGNNVELSIFFHDFFGNQACNRVINGIPVNGGLVNRVGQGRALFISHDKLQGSEFLRDDSIRVVIKEIIVYAAPLPEIAPSAVLDFVITNFSKCKRSNEECISQSFYSHEYGYKLSLLVYPNGRDKWKNKYISIFVHLMKGENDDKLTFPFRGDILVQIVNWRENKRHVEQLIEFNKETDPRGDYGARVTGLAGFLSGRQYRGYGFPDFLSHEFLEFDESRNTQYVNDDDSIHVRVTKITLA